MSTTTSEQVADIAAALAKVQGEIAGAHKSAANPFFKSKYADLASVWDACRGQLSNHGIAIVQSPSADGVRVTVETTMMHISGQWIRSALSVAAKDDGPQAIGSAITYLRRYGLQSMVGVAPEDDDGEAAQGRSHESKRTAKTSALVERVNTETGEVKTNRICSFCYRTHPDHADDCPEAKKEASQPSKPYTGTGSALVSEAQIKRLFAISKKAGWTNERLKALIIHRGFQSTKDILKSAYPAICEAIEAPVQDEMPSQEDIFTS